MQLFEGLDAQHTIFEPCGDVIVFTEELHDLFLATALEGGLKLRDETVVMLVVLCPSKVLCLGFLSLILDGFLAEEVVAVEESISPNSKSRHPDRSNSPQPPGVSLGDEVCVVKHSYDYINSQDNLPLSIYHKQTRIIWLIMRRILLY